MRRRTLPARGEYWYLDDGVEPTKTTVPELRGILLQHGVRYPASAKEPALVELFTVDRDASDARNPTIPD